MTDYGAMLRSRRIETRFSVCLRPSLAWDRALVTRSQMPDADTLAALDEQIRESTVVLVLRALTEDETWSIDARYTSAKPGTPEARAMDKETLVQAFIQWETLDGDEITSMDATDLIAYWDSASPGERVPLLALSLELRTFSPTVPF